ncbi:MAG: outer membrane lipoprotein carrier protein LolA [Saprospiraceae bacterium]|nr:outer membrane lipoprotein carrier protein LolA [Saprospiraceae bacterium]
MGTFATDFEFKMDIPESGVESRKGILYLKGDKYRLVMNEEEIISDNVNVWHWTKSVNEVQVNYFDNDEEIISPSDIFSMYLKGFGYKLITEAKYQGVNVALIELVPAARDRDYFKVKVVVDTDAHQLQQMQVFFKDGIVYTFNFSELRPKNLEDWFFEFDSARHPEVEIIDLR